MQISQLFSNTNFKLKTINLASNKNNTVTSSKLLRFRKELFTFRSLWNQCIFEIQRIIYKTKVFFFTATNFRKYFRVVFLTLSSIFSTPNMFFGWYPFPSKHFYIQQTKTWKNFQYNICINTKINISLLLLYT